jgi:hypothetical protein
MSRVPRKAKQIEAVLTDVSKGIPHPEARPMTQKEVDDMNRRLSGGYRATAGITINGFEFEIKL